jgi:hypothetical protein
MASYNLQANDISQSTPKLQKGPVTLRAGESRTLNLPVKCSRIAVLAVSTPGAVTIEEEIGGAKASCSA